MRLALGLAERARGHTHPNPIVGAVVVKARRILARGYHHAAGDAHAEIDALGKIDFAARGATLYVTLEPCCHTGRTGPCTLPIIAAGVRRVVVGCRDPNPLVNGRGSAALRRAGIRVDIGCLETECQTANRAFFRWVQDGRPWVTLKAAATLDGFIAPSVDPGPSAKVSTGIRWITGPAARQVGHELREAHDAVLVGAGTVLADDPRLTVRLGRASKRPAPLRVVLDGQLSTPPSARLFGGSSGRALIIAARSPRRPPAQQRAFARRLSALQDTGAEILLLDGDGNGRIPLPQVLTALARRGVQSILVEGGSRVHGALIETRMVDEVALFVAPQLWGGGLPIASGGPRASQSPLSLGPFKVRHIDGDILLSAEVIHKPRQNLRP